MSFDKPVYYNIAHEGSITLWFMGFMSSQYMIKDVVILGDKFLSSVDQGWVEEISGQGAFKLSSGLRKSLLSLNAGASPLLIMVGDRKSVV